MTGRMETHRPALPSSSRIVPVWSVSPEKPLMASRQTSPAVNVTLRRRGRIRSRIEANLLTGWSGLEFPRFLGHLRAGSVELERKPSRSHAASLVAACYATGPTTD